MPVFLGFESSDILLERLSRGGLSCVARTYRVPGSEVPDMDLVHLIGQALGCRSIDVVVASPAGRLKNGFVTCRSWQGRFPREAFLTDGSEVFLASPEFSLMLAAGAFPDLGLMQLLMRYLGEYSPSKADPDGFVRREPLTSIENVLAMLGEVKGLYGTGKLRRALGMAIEGARSPMETNVALALTLPKKSNGFGLPKPRMNERIELDGQARAICGKTHCYADMLWGNHILEYQGRRHNDTWGEDLSRALALELMGYTVDFMAYEQFADARQLNLIAQKIARSLGMWVNASTWPDSGTVQGVVDELLRR